MEMRDSLKGLTAFEIERASLDICHQITELIRPQDHIIGSFASLSIEPQLFTLHRLLPDRQIAYPLSSPDGSMEFYLVDDPSTLVKGLYGIQEPSQGLHEKVAPEAIDVLLTPAFAYTSDGFRLGKGGGYYDRFLEINSPRTLGVIFSRQLLPEIPHETHDQRVSAVIHA